MGKGEREEPNITEDGSKIGGLSLTSLTVITAVAVLVKPSPCMSAAWRISVYWGNFCRHREGNAVCVTWGGEALGPACEETTPARAAPAPPTWELRGLQHPPH